MRLKLEDEYKLPKSAKRVALEVMAFVLVLGGVIGVMALSIAGPKDQPFERGVMLGTGLAPVALIAGGIGFLVQSRRLRARGSQDV